MTTLVADPLKEAGLAGFAQQLRTGTMTARQATEAYLQRIAVLNPKLDAYLYVAEREALTAAEGIDRLLAAGTDLGPLMGVPIAIKDLFAVTGMPARAGSNLDLADCIGVEGGFVRLLKQAGCVILGKVRTVEFAAGAQNMIHPTPWNPCDPNTKRTPGGSSHGSAVAVAAGLCGFAVGSDTGGSVRVPAALCGIVGLKTTYATWPLDGIFPLCPAMDTVGLLTASAADASFAYAALTGTDRILDAGLHGVRLGIPQPNCIEDMDAEVAADYQLALERLEAGGAVLVPITWPTPDEQAEIKAIFAGLVPSDLLATLGRERVQTQRAVIDPVAVNRLDGAMALSAMEYSYLQRRQKQLARLAAERIAGIDAVVTPTSPITPRPVAALDDVTAASAFTAKCLGNTRSGNVYDLCAVTVPIHSAESNLPVGLQIACEAKQERRMLSLAQSIERIVSPPSRGDMMVFV